MEPLTLPRTLDALEPIRHFVAAAAASAGMDKMRIHRLCLAVDEIATNSILYGSQDNGETGMIEVRGMVEGNGVKIVLEDACKPFDPTAHETPDAQDRPLEEREAGGLGIYLAVGGVDRLLYERVADRNRTVFVISDGKA